LSDRNTRTPAQAIAALATWARVIRSMPDRRRISSVNTGPQARISELEKAVDQ
jgi:hypothetical protein